MAELKEGTLKITVTEAALKVLGEQHQVTLRYGKDLAQCDKCMVWMAQEEIGYRDQLPYVRTECRGCHEHDWRCEEDFGEDSCPHEHQGVPEWEEVRGRMRTDFCRCGARRFSNAIYAWPWETSADGQRDTDTTRKV